MAAITDFTQIKTMITRSARSSVIRAAAHEASADLQGAADAGWAERIDELLSIRSFGDDWDGQGAKAPSVPLVDGAIRFAQDFAGRGIDPADRVVASVNGTVVFEWHRPGGYLEVEVTAPDAAEARSVAAGSDRAESVGICQR